MTYPPIVHHRTALGTDCNIERSRRWASANITSTRGWAKVSCLRCLKHKPAEEA